MKFSVLSSIVFLLPLLAGQVSAGVAGRAANGKAAGANQGAAAAKGGAAGAKGAAAKGGNNGAAAKGGAAGAAATKASSAASTATAAAATASGAAAAGGDPQTSLTLDPKVLATGFEQDGQAVQEAGQVASLTSSNNFINFCATVPDKPITNGQQIKTGSCNPAPMGVIAASTNMPSSKFTNPKNLDTIPANQAFTVTMAIKNLETGFFVNANSNYFSAPQQVNAQGNINGHSHFVIEKLSALDQTTVTDPTTFVFFKGVNGKAVNGVLSADVTAGLPDGVYRLASINSAANHQPALVAVAQHGSLDDMVYFTVGNGGGAAGAAGAANSTAAAGAKGGKGGNAAAAASTSAASSAAASASAATGAKGAAGAKGAGGAKGAAGATGAAAGGAKGAAAGGKGGAQGAKGGAQGGKARRSRIARERS